MKLKTYLLLDSITQNMQNTTIEKYENKMNNNNILCEQLAYKKTNGLGDQ